ncbi:MAG: hypothetical protein AB7O46_15960 [Xanthobacteraceae bacterium]
MRHARTLKLMPAGKPGRRLDDSSAFEVRNRLFVCFCATLDACVRRVFSQMPVLLFNALTLQAESVRRAVGHMTVAQRNHETNFLRRIMRKNTISNPARLLIQQGSVTLYIFRSNRSM